MKLDLHQNSQVKEQIFACAAQNKRRVSTNQNFKLNHLQGFQMVWRTSSLNIECHFSKLSNHKILISQVPIFSSCSMVSWSCCNYTKMLFRQTASWRKCERQFCSFHWPDYAARLLQIFSSPAYTSPSPPLTPSTPHQPLHYSIFLQQFSVI